MSSKRYTVDMCSGAVLPKLFRVALPLMLSSLLQLVFNAADIMVVGNFGSEHSLEAVGSTNAVINLLTTLFIGLSLGANVLCARYMGAKDTNGVSKTVHSSMMVALIGGAALTVIGLIFADDLLLLMKSPQEVIDLSTLYVRIYFLGMIPMLIYNFGSSLLRAKGDTGRPLIFLAIAGVVNVLLNSLFVIVFKMDVAGVAWATTISQTLSATMVVICLMRETDAFHLTFKKLRLHRSVVLQLLRIGIPSGLQGIVFSLSNAVIQSGVNSLGPVVMAGSAAASSIEGFIWMSMSAFSQSSITFVSQNVGAGKYSRINRIVLVSCACVTAFGVVLGNLAYLFGEPLIGLYDPRPEIVEPGLARMQIICGVYFLGGLMDCMANVMRGLGYSVLPTAVSVAGSCGIRLLWVATIFQIPQYHNVKMLYMVFTVSWGATLLAHLICYLFARRKFPKTDTCSE